jgi:hypothetical protein
VRVVKETSAAAMVDTIAARIGREVIEVMLWTPALKTDAG